jgi:hypothetical protein
VATEHTRATDSDRNDTCQVLDSALGEGQLSMEEHRQRVSTAIKATTLGELRSLMSDLQIRSTPVPLQRLKSPAGGWGVRIAVAVVVVLLGAGIAWGLHGNTSSPSKITSDPGATPTGSGGAVVTSTAAPPQAPPQLLSLGGLTGLLAQMRKQFGDTLGYQLVVYPDQATLDRPDSVNAHKTAFYDYSGGDWIDQGASAIPPSSTVGDLSMFDVQQVLGVLHRAPETLHIRNATETYLIIEAAEDGSLDLEIHLSDDSRSGYVELAADGAADQTQAPGS